jgi:hypothetical protein
MPVQQREEAEGRAEEVDYALNGQVQSEIDIFNYSSLWL